MLFPRLDHGCGTIDGSGSKEVVVAGGVVEVTAGDESVEIYSFPEDTWRMGEDFNKACRNAYG